MNQPSPSAANPSEKFWCDGFDLDLLQILPDLKPAFSRAPNVKLITRGHVTGGKLNHPAAWNTHHGLAAFFFIGDIKTPPAYWTNAAVVRCTIEEAIRDAWIHHLAVIVEGIIIFNAHKLRLEFERILYTTRGWQRYEILFDLQTTRDAVKAALADFELLAANHVHRHEI